MTLPKDPIKREEYLKKKRMPLKEETKKKISEIARERGKDPEFRKKMSISHKILVKERPELIRNLTNAAREVVKGSKHTPEHCKRISEALKGHKVSKETIEKISRENHYNWNNGSSFEPYCPRFTKEFKERVRAFFGHFCIECGQPENGKKHCVHHVTFNKKTCCDNTTPLFVPLCPACHTKTIRDREYWQKHFTDIINEYYGGKCYLTKDEF